MGNANFTCPKLNDLSVKITPSEISFDGTLHITLNDVSNNSPPPYPHKSMFVKISDGSTYIEPNLTELVPPLLEHCERGILQKKFHCRHLYHELFKCANHRNTDKPFFKRIADESTHFTMHDTILYHVSKLLKPHRKDITIEKVCSDVEGICNEFLNDTHPLSKQLLKFQSQK